MVPGHGQRLGRLRHLPAVLQRQRRLGLRHVRLPRRLLESYSAGAFDINDTIACFSSRGPSAFEGEIKPNIAAPGVNVRSSFPGDSYGAFSGTSMASPHVAGTVALMWSAAPALVGDIDATKALLDDDRPRRRGPAVRRHRRRQQRLGRGQPRRLPRRRAVPARRHRHARPARSPTPRPATRSPARQVTVTGPIDRTVTTGDERLLQLLLTVGTYDVTVNAFGYAVETATAEVTEGATTTLDFALDPLPTTVVTGTVTDGSGHGWPLYARIDIDGFPGGPVFTDPVTGAVQRRAARVHRVHVQRVARSAPATSPRAARSRCRPTRRPRTSRCRSTPPPASRPATSSSVHRRHRDLRQRDAPDGWDSDRQHRQRPGVALRRPGATGATSPAATACSPIMDSDFYGPSGQQDTALVSPVVRHVGRRPTR